MATKERHGKYVEGQTVHTSEHVRQETGDWPPEMDGTLMHYVGNSQWDVYVPGHGQVTVSESDL